MTFHECTYFQKNPYTHLIGHVWTKSCPQTEDRQTDRPDRVKPINPPNFISGGYKKN